MDKTNRAIVYLYIHGRNEKFELDIPLDITAYELLIGLNEAYHLNMNMTDVSTCFLKTENPIALIRGNRLLSEYGLRNGTIINIVE